MLQLDLILETLGNDEGFTARVPAVPGYTAWGTSDAEAIENAKGVVLAMLASYREHGDAPPPALMRFMDADPVRVEFAVPLAA